jgi:hypothetical protein
VIRDYLTSRGLNISSEQLNVLVHAHDAAWTLLCKCGRCGNNDPVLKERLAGAVVDLVISEGQTDPRVIAQTAVRSVLTP